MVEVEEFDLDPEFQQHDIKPTNDAEDTHKAIESETEIVPVPDNAMDLLEENILNKLGQMNQDLLQQQATVFQEKMLSALMNAVGKDDDEEESKFRPLTGTKRSEAPDNVTQKLDSSYKILEKKANHDLDMLLGSESNRIKPRYSFTPSKPTNRSRKSQRSTSRRGRGRRASSTKSASSSTRLPKIAKNKRRAATAAAPLSHIPVSSLLKETQRILKDVKVSDDKSVASSSTSPPKSRSPKSRTSPIQSAPPSKVVQSRFRATTTRRNSSNSASRAVTSAATRSWTRRSSNNGASTTQAQQWSNRSSAATLDLPPSTNMGQLPETEWENEIARSILQIYHAKLHDDKDGGDGDTTADTVADATMTATAATASNTATTASTTTNTAASAPTTSVKASSSLSHAATAEFFNSNSDQLADMAFGKFDPFQPGKGPAFGGALKKRYRRRPIWFAGAGDVQASWCSLCDQSPGGGDPVPRMEGVACDHRLCTELRQLEKKSKFDKYVALVEGLLYASIHRKGVSRPHDLLWRQLVVVTSIFCQKSVDQGQFKKSLRMQRKARTLLDKQDAIFFMGEEEFQVLRKELLAYITDFSSYHYWKRGKHEAAIQDCKKVIQLQRGLKHMHEVAKARLHLACALSHSRQHKKAIMCLGKVVEMVERGELEGGGSSAEKLCLVAVCYHNIAVEQLILKRYQQACISSQNARRLARLSLSYSNRWLKQFDATHKAALVSLCQTNAIRERFADGSQAALFKQLSKELYS